ncbi:hypothetical protein [Autumnicola psychrophila]|uniref:Uncharacterized protein n=1 Tax=Autumnicola psychrophila TaxID=3075592 RepID=A0ABU3DQS1_9FLAO|nr:hypothetical protein [Zunongwangia sp. F225]MDT0686046.1 hypothetical protein [Zunongwangia sp. F225]
MRFTLITILFLVFTSGNAQNYYYTLDTNPEAPRSISPLKKGDFYLEAEEADNSNAKWEFYMDPDASGGAYAKVPKYAFEDFDNWNTKPDNTSERLKFTIENVEAGEYTVWIRGKRNGRNREFWVTENNNEKGYEVFDLSSDGTYDWISNHGSNGLSSSDKKIRFNLKEGKNIITIFRKHSAYQIDRIFLTKNGSVPTEEYENSKAVVTSAGVYKEDGTLVRTLWNNELKSSKILETKPDWDFKDDFGNMVNPGNYQIKITTSDVKYEWEGVVGNTSDDFQGNGHVIGSYARMLDMVTEGKYGYIAMGYSEPENNPSSLKIDLENPYKRIEFETLNPFNRGQESYAVTSDGKTVYWGGLDPYSHNSSKWFVFGTKVIDDTFQNFENGNSYRPPSGKESFPSIFGELDNENGHITGMAVQRTGKYLYVVHKNLNLIKVYDKNTGEAVMDIANLNQPFKIFIDAKGSGNLWISHQEGVEKFKISDDGSLEKAGVLITNNQVLSISGEHSGNTITLIDGKDQQLKTYSTGDGKLIKTFGQKGGYENSPDVYDDKFYFGDDQNNFQPHAGITFAAYEADGSVWINDTWNHRVQHFNGTTLEHSLYTQDPLKQVAINPNMPKRLFYYYHEFEIDYSKPFKNFNNSWKLKRNWRGKMKSFGRDGMAAGFQNVVTLSNGKTYAQTLSPNDNNSRFYEIVELDPINGLRYTGITQDRFGEMLHYDGTLRPRGSYNSSTNSATWYKREVTGFNNNNPIWGGKVNLAKVENLDKNDVYNFGASSIPSPMPEVTSGGIIIAYNSDKPDNGGTNFHLGGIKTGSDTYLWKTSPNTPEGYSGNYPTDGRFDISNGVGYNAGGICVTIDNHVFWSYRGEFWKQRQTNYWQHYNANTGAMLGRFGTHVYKTPAKGQAGNMFSGGIVEVNGNYYLYHNGEAHHYGVHRWKISNLDSVKEYKFPVEVSN